MNQEIHVSMDHAHEVTPIELVPILVPLGSLGATIVAIAIVLYYRFRSQKQRHELVKAYLDRAQEPPASLLGVEPARRNGDLRRGLVLFALGVGLSISLAIARQWDAVGFGVVPALIGAAYFVVWRVEGRGRDEPGRG